MTSKALFYLLKFEDELTFLINIRIIMIKSKKTIKIWIVNWEVGFLQNNICIWIISIFTDHFLFKGSIQSTSLYVNMILRYQITNISRVISEKKGYIYSQNICYSKFGCCVYCTLDMIDLGLFFLKILYPKFLVA